MSKQQTLIFRKRNFDLFSKTIFWESLILTLYLLVEQITYQSLTVPMVVLVHLLGVSLLACLTDYIFFYNNEKHTIKENMLLAFSKIPITDEELKKFYSHNKQPDIHKYMDFVADKLSETMDGYQESFKKYTFGISSKFIPERFDLIENCVREHLIAEKKISKNIPLENYHLYHYEFEARCLRKGFKIGAKKTEFQNYLNGKIIDFEKLIAEGEYWEIRTDISKTNVLILIYEHKKEDRRLTYVNKL